MPIVDKPRNTIISEHSISLVIGCSPLKLAQLPHGAQSVLSQAHHGVSRSEARDGFDGYFM
jgi:hypothetical protein